jgi:beta-glucanase (GH16 family)
MKLHIIILLTLVSLTCRCQKKQVIPDGFTKLVWSDEFNGKGLPDNRNWTYEDGYKRNHELQFYTRNRVANAHQDGGNLVITARNDSMKYGGKTLPVTSAALVTKGLHEWTYGRIEVRAKIPSSLGTWPAIWMLGANIDAVDWPLSGEIDIMEHVGYMPDTLHFNVHTKKYNHAAGSGKGTRIYFPSPDKGFHIYAIEWYPERIDWYFDGNKVFTYENEKTGEDAWPFDKPQYLLLNLAFGGDWGGRRGIDLKSLPQSMLVDYVRVYQ